MDSTVLKSRALCQRRVCTRYTAYTQKQQYSQVVPQWIRHIEFCNSTVKAVKWRILKANIWLLRFKSFKRNVQKSNSLIHIRKRSCLHQVDLWIRDSSIAVVFSRILEAISWSTIRPDCCHSWPIVLALSRPLSCSVTSSTNWARWQIVALLLFWFDYSLIEHLMCCSLEANDQGTTCMDQKWNSWRVLGSAWSRHQRAVV